MKIFPGSGRNSLGMKNPLFPQNFMKCCLPHFQSCFPLNQALLVGRDGKKNINPSLGSFGADRVTPAPKAFGHPNHRMPWWLSASLCSKALQQVSDRMQISGRTWPCICSSAFFSHTFLVNCKMSVRALWGWVKQDVLMLQLLLCPSALRCIQQMHPSFVLYERI